MQVLCGSSVTFYLNLRRKIKYTIFSTVMFLFLLRCIHGFTNKSKSNKIFGISTKITNHIEEKKKTKNKIQITFFLRNLCIIE